MEPPLKRPRLSIFDQGSSGLELDDARYSNDMDLKRKFESIFTKYARDFSGIGDEIDIMSGQVIVNNGHLESMETETDPGNDTMRSGFASTGRSMLRAMTVALDADLPGPDDVLTSIETIAENATFTDGLIDESEDVGSETWKTSTNFSSQFRSSDIEEHGSDACVEPYNSDSDSLFGEETLRSESVDSLFEEESSSKLTQIGHEPKVYSSIKGAGVVSRSTQLGNQKHDLVPRLRSDIGEEVLDLTDQQQETHIEPAWRIPIKLDHPRAHPSTPHVSSPSVGRSPNSKQNKSLWTLPRSMRKSSSPIIQVARSVREESIDPLQEGFCSDQDATVHQSEEDDLPNSSESESVDLDDFSGYDLVQATASGICPYCKVNFGTKAHVMAHWDRWLRQPAMNVKENDLHDLGLMKMMRSKAMVHRRGPRLRVDDFRTMVELHEGAGLSFDHIFASKTLRTTKRGPQLQDEYNRYRDISKSDGSSKKRRAWAAAEEQVLQEMCNNPVITMAGLPRGLKGRDELEIGNHLAEIWLGQLKAVEKASTHRPRLPRDI